MRIQARPHPTTDRRFAVAVLLMLIVSALPAQGATPLPVTPLPAVLDTGGHLGTCYANYQIDGQYLAPLAQAAGSRWDRVDFSWNRIEPQKNVFNYSGYDDLVTRAQDHELEVVGILGSTASWAAGDCPTGMTVATSPPSELLGHPAIALERHHHLMASDWNPCPPRNLHLEWDHPDNHWGTFVYETVTHFKGRVRVWEIWNEPDLYDWFWKGSVADYAQLLRVGYQAAKAANPEATVLFAGLAYWAAPDYYVAVLDELAAMEGADDDNHYFDVLSLHLYSSIYTIGPVTARIQADMVARVGSRPIWLTETGVPLWDEGGFEHHRLNRATAEEAAAYVIAGFAEARAAGVERFFFFRTHDDNMAEGLFGLIRDDGSFRPSYLAYQVAAGYLHGENQVTGPFTHHGVRRITFWATPRGRIDVLWNTGGDPVTYSHPAYLPTATLVTHRGITTTQVAANGVFTTTLAPATANTGEGGGFIIGGPPVLLIQQDQLPPTSRLHPLPELVYATGLTLTWDAADEGAGYWYAEVERASAPQGPWTQVAGLAQTQGVTTTFTAFPGSGTWYYRARVRDHVGNWEDWPTTAEISTTAVTTRTVGLSITADVDAGGEGGNPAATEAITVSLTWQDAQGAVIAAHAGSVEASAGQQRITWEITRTVEAGDYLITARAADYLPAQQRFTVAPGPTPLSQAFTLDLKAISARVYLPRVTRQP